MSELSCGTRFIGRHETLDLSHYTLYIVQSLYNGTRTVQAYALKFTTDYRPAPIRTGNLISTPRAYA
jgi:hypothetical protein